MRVLGILNILIKFKEWMKIREMMGSVGSIVSCRDLKNKNFQVQGALSNLKCGRRKRKNV